jgi:divalent metal cation (Fe/Co/Zn/Cd) transporter
VTITAKSTARLDATKRGSLVRLALLLAWSSLAWMTVEGTIAVVAGVLANSTALIGFGGDSAIEGLASVVIIWRFSGGRSLSDAAERRAQKLVAVSFFLLAPYVAAEAIRALVTGSKPTTSWLGIGLTIASVILMPLLGVAKKRVGAQLHSAATAGEGTQNLICAYLAIGVLAGLIANTAFGWWWLDPPVALGIAALAVHEGREAWEGDACC